jgi:hypothetical protein
MHSGAITATIRIFNFLQNILKGVSFESGTFGWIATQVHEKIIVRQLHMRLNSVLVFVELGSGEVSLLSIMIRVRFCGAAMVENAETRKSTSISGNGGVEWCV